MGNLNMPITAIVQKGMPKPSGKSDSPKVSPAGWPMKDSPIKSRGGRNDHDMGNANWEAHKKTMHGMRDHSGNESPLKKISGACKTAAKKKFDVWPSAYASGWGVRCTRAGGPGKMGKKSPAKQSKPKFTDKRFEKSERLQSKADKAASKGKNKKAARLENRVARVEKREDKKRAKYNY